jgi:N,N'-diacetyllegionaminate synthase
MHALRDWFADTRARCLIVGEVAQAHDGSLGAAHAYIKAVAEAGADAVKFQTHIAEAESTPAEPWRVKFSPQDETRYAYWKRMEFTADQWRGLASHAADLGLIFLSSPFSLEAVDLLERLDLQAWKIGAGEVSNLPLLDRVARTGKPVILSSGMSGWSEIDRAVDCVRQAGAPLAVLQCTTAYPCPPEMLGLNVLDQLRERYHCRVGLSDHSGTIYAGLAAASLGAKILEVHVTFSRQSFGPDVPASITMPELRTLVDGTRFIERALESPVDKDRVSEGMGDLRRAFNKSIVAARDLPAGHVLHSDDLRFKKPGTGIPAARAVEFAGRRLKRRVAADALLAEDDLE